jgi:hypothetical protein
MGRHLRGIIALLAVLIPFGARAVENGHPFGYFPERPQLEWLDDGRKMQLLRAFVYIDQRSNSWIAPKDAVVDGASIPPVLWSFVGGPYEGRYRNASIVHDTECDAKSHKWQDVHRMFYYASRAGGVGLIKAWLMYAAVYEFGPRWNVVKPPPSVPADRAKDYLARVVVILRRESRAARLTDESATFQRLENLSYESVVKQVPDDDPELAQVRSLLAERERISINSTRRDDAYREALQKVDDALYLQR